MKKFIEARLFEASFSTPSEYIRNLIRDDQERSSRRELEAFLRGELRGKAVPTLDEEAWRAVEKILRQQKTRKELKRRNGTRRRPSKEQ